MIARVDGHKSSLLPQGRPQQQNRGRLEGQVVAVLTLQRLAGNQAVASLLDPHGGLAAAQPVIQRQRGGQSRSGAQIGYFAVGDPHLNYEGAAVFLHNLEELPSAMMRFRGGPDWTMVLSIHGAEDILSGEGGRVSRRSGNIYDEARV